MATTRLITRHISKGKTIAQSLAECLGYGKNSDKTQGGKLISSYMCDAATVDAEFLLGKAQYKAVTGREQNADADILCYQIRQSFRVGEITPEAANQIGYDMAMRWTKGKHAFLVTTHVDRPHVHTHIYYNSAALDCTRKFRNFWGSTWAIRRLSDLICLENGLSIVEKPKLHSRGKYKHYGQWQQAEGGGQPQSWKARLKVQIDACLAQKPESMDGFMQAMTAAGYEVRYGRGGVISFRAQGQERFTRLRASTLGTGYNPEDIQAVIDGRAPLPGRRQPAALPRVNLVIDIQERMRAGKGPAYAQWAKIHNLKMMAQTLQYLRENNLLEYGQLAERAAASSDHFHALSEQIKVTEAAMSRNVELMAAVVAYAKTRPVFEEYKATRYNRAFLADHEADITLYRATQDTFRRVLAGAKLPKMDALKTEQQALAAEKKDAYRQYRAVKKDMQELVAAKGNIDRLFALTEPPKNKEQAR